MAISHSFAVTGPSRAPEVRKLTDKPRSSTDNRRVGLVPEVPAVWTGSAMRPAAKSLLLLLLLTAAAFAARAAAALELTVFGDSYSIPVHDGNRDWPTQLRAQGAVGTVHDFAKSGAIAASIGTNTSARQIRLWNAAGRPLGATVVYLGYNDIGGDLTKSRAG